MASYNTLSILVLFCFIYGNNPAGAKSRISNNRSVLNTIRTNNTKYGTSPPSYTEKLKISVYYETLCPASVNFFVRELGPTVENLGSFIDVHMVPYGNVKERKFRGQNMLQCQHGPDECYGNKIHSCVINVITNNTEAVRFNVCLMKYTSEHYYVNFEGALNSCGYKHKIDTNYIEKCVNSERSAILFKNYGEETNKFFRQYDGDYLVEKYVPYVVFKNDRLNKIKDRTDNFLRNVCNVIHPPPKACYM